MVWSYVIHSLETLDATIVFPTFSIATILIVTLVGLFAFKEKLKPIEVVGLILITISIVLLNL